MISIILSILLTYLQGTGSIVFFDLFQARQRNTPIFWGTFFCALFCYSLILNFVAFPHTILKIIVSLILYFVFNWLLFQGKLFYRILIVVLFYSSINIIESMWTFTILHILSLNIQQLFASYALYIFTSIGAELFFIAICILLKKPFSSHRQQSAWNRLWSIPLLLSIGSLTLIVYLLIYTTYNNRTESNIILACSCFLIGSNIVVILLIDCILRAFMSREESIILHEKLHSQEKSLGALSAAYATQRKMTHDFNAHLLTLSGLLAQNEASQANTYIQELIGQQSKYVLFVRTHNAAIDAILNQKAFNAKKATIDFRFVVNDLSNVVIRISDLSVIIGNTLDNAIEACLNLPENERTMEVHLILENSQLLFCVRNRSLPLQIKDGMIISSKTDHPNLHGYGLANVRTILSYYSQQFSLTYENGWTQFVAELPNILLS